MCIIIHDQWIHFRQWSQSPSFSGKAVECYVVNFDNLLMDLGCHSTTCILHHICRIEISCKYEALYFLSKIVYTDSTYHICKLRISKIWYFSILLYTVCSVATPHMICKSDGVISLTIFFIQIWWRIHLMESIHKIHCPSKCEMETTMIWTNIVIVMSQFCVQTDIWLILSYVWSTM